MKNPLGDERSEESFSLSFSWSEDEFERESLEESIGTPSVVCPESIIGEEGEEFWKKLGNLQGSLKFPTWLSIFRPNRRDIIAFIFLTFSKDEDLEEGGETRPLGFTSGWLGKVLGSLENDVNRKNYSGSIWFIRAEMEWNQEWYLKKQE